VDVDDFDEALAVVRDLISHEVVPSEDEIEHDDHVPDRLRRRAAEMGLFGYAIPVEYGGLGFTMSQEVLLAMELGRTTPAFRSMFGTNNGIAGQTLVLCGTPEQRERYLPRLASGEVVAAFALTEEQAGSDPTGLRTKATRDGDHYVVSGRKRFITNALDSDILVVFARTEDVPGQAGISAFIVSTDADGVRIGPKDAKMGQRGTATSEVFFDDVRVPVSDLVGGAEGLGYRAAMQSLAKGRMHVAGLSVGAAERLIDESVEHATNHAQGGTMLAEFQLVQAMLADSVTEAYAARATVVEAARRYDAGQDRRLGPSVAKLFCTEMVGRVADRAVQIHGGLGYMHGMAVERFFRDVRLFRLYEGTSEIQRLIIAKQSMREARA